MIRILLIFTLSLFGLKSFSQSFNAIYPFSGVISGSVNTGSIDPTPSPTVTGTIFGSFTTVGTYTAPSASNVFCFGGWGIGATNNNDINFTGSLDTGAYYKVLITPQTNYSISLSSITFNMARSTTGPRHWALRSNKDNYITNLPAGISSNPNLSVSAGNVFFWTTDSYTIASGNQEKGCVVTLSGANFMSQTTPYAFRFYAWDSETTPGTFRIDTAIFSGLTTMALGINNLTQNINSSINIYPNPSNNGFVYVDVNDINYYSIEVLDMFGHVVISEKSEVQKKVLDLSSLNEGTYFIRLISETKVFTEHFIISK